MSEQVMIWSGEHRMWWRPEGKGYTAKSAVAGRYTREDAESRTSHCGPEKKIEIVEPGSPRFWEIAGYTEDVELLRHIEAIRTERDALVEALTPSAETKAAFIGEFRFKREATDEDGECCVEHITVPWTTVKEIMKAIRAKALAPALKAEPEKVARG